MRSGILLVGGFGTRLHPLTLKTPKPFLRVGGVPFLDHQIYKAKAAGITELVLATSYKAEVFSDYYGDGSKFGLEIKYAIEDEPLGTGGAIRNALKLTSSKSESITIFNGDVLSEFDLNKQIESTFSHGATASLYLTQVQDARPFGVVTLNESGFIEQFLEKMENPISNIINAGCYVFSKDLKEKIISQFEDHQVVSVEREIFPSLLAAGEKIFGYVENTYWLDIGTPAALVKASADLISGKVKSPARNLPGAPNQIGAGTLIDPSAQIIGGSDIQDKSVIKKDSIIEASTIGSEVVVEESCQIIRSIIADKSVVPAGSILIDNFFGF